MFPEAEVFAVETVPVRVQTAEQQRQGPEATFVWSMAETGRELESWLVFVRYNQLDGAMMVSWYKNVMIWNYVMT